MSADFFSAWLESVSRRVESRLDEILSPPSPSPSLLAAMRHAALNGGKRLRPAILLAVAENNSPPAGACIPPAEGCIPPTGDSFPPAGDCIAPVGGCTPDRNDPPPPRKSERDSKWNSGTGLVPVPFPQNPKALDAACALELAHCYSLVHDDLPAMDDASERRGKPSCHRAHGEAEAILAGDALQALAFKVMAQSLPSGVPLLADAVGASGMCGGQSLDLSNAAQTESDLSRTHEMKTGRLFLCALRAGFLCRESGPESGESGRGLEEWKMLEQFGREFGLMFQICDDLRGESEDRQNARKTYATLLGRKIAQHRAATSRAAALAALSGTHPRLARITEMVYATSAPPAQ